MDLDQNQQYTGLREPFPLSGAAGFSVSCHAEKYGLRW